MTQTPTGPAAQPPTGVVRLTIQGSVLTSNMITPTARINGQPVPTRYGVQDLPVWAGRNHIDMEAQWMRSYGQAAIDVDVPAGGVVPVFYAAPYHQFTTGSIGLEKQKRKGVGFLVALSAVAVVVLVALVLGVLLSS